jgi:signal transduction histidine kinase
VFTTGNHIPHEEISGLFAEGFRGLNSVDKPGTGHGLAFIRHVIELHGGKVGYEPTSQGNNFYFILPLPTIKLLQPWPDNE